MGGTPGASSATMRHALSSSVPAVPVCRARLATPGRIVPAPSVGSQLPEIGEGQCPTELCVFSRQMSSGRGWVGGPGCLTDGQLQLLQVKCAIRQMWQGLGVDTGDLCAGQGRAWS